MIGITRIDTEMRWCDECKKNFPAYYIEFEDYRWILINPHEHGLYMGICPQTVWMCVDISINDFPGELKEIFELCKDITVRENQEKLMEKLKELKEKSKENNNNHLVEENEQETSV